MGEKRVVDVEQEIFKALTNPIRREIIQEIGKRENVGFNELLRAINLSDSSKLSYHLKSLSILLTQNNKKYQLSELGRDVFTLLVGVEKYRNKISHMGMVMTEEEHERWHTENREILPEEHEKLMRKMGVSKEQDAVWHTQHEELVVNEDSLLSVNPFMIGGGFIDYCIGKGWMTREGKGKATRYYLTKIGKEEIKKYGIKMK